MTSIDAKTVPAGEAQWVAPTDEEMAETAKNAVSAGLSLFGGHTEFERAIRMSIRDRSATRDRLVAALAKKARVPHWAAWSALMDAIPMGEERLLDDPTRYLAALDVAARSLGASPVLLIAFD